ncbi:MAG: ThiF family adenylyltransferase [Sphingobacteriia bacterium]|jgi:hypothetical protein
MSQQLINLNSDLKRLRDEGYEIEVHCGYIIIHHVPYVNSKKEVKYGALVSSLTLANQTTVSKPDTHTIYFDGDDPCNIDGSHITAIMHSHVNIIIKPELPLIRMFSNKPPNGYSNYYEKFINYIRIITSPAKALDENATAQTYKLIETKDDESVFQYIDTNSSRADINSINAKLTGQKIAIIGLGGTGAYILDLLSKTPVAEIHLYDGDTFLQHNAFRSPGAASTEKLNKQMKKVEYYAEMYSNLHKHVIPHNYYVTDENKIELDSKDYVFICIDKGESRSIITKHLVNKSVTFIDVGLGVNIVDDSLIGSVRVTTADSKNNIHLSNRLPGAANDDNEYGTNIQIADLNALNAVLAIIKWKKLSGFYKDLIGEYHSSFALTTSKIFNDDIQI